jgi:hypothetical protein
VFNNISASFIAKSMLPNWYCCSLLFQSKSIGHFFAFFIGSSANNMSI